MSPTPPRTNKRRFRRRTVRVLVDFHGGTGIRCEYATTLGAGGLFIETETPLHEHSALKMRFRLPGSGTTHEIEGRVVWRRRPHDPGSHSPGMGIEFTDRAATASLARELETLK